MNVGIFHFVGEKYADEFCSKLIIGCELNLFLTQKMAFRLPPNAGTVLNSTKLVSASFPHPLNG